jgi:hypothetical protein
LRLSSFTGFFDETRFIIFIVVVVSRILEFLFKGLVFLITF